MINVKDSLPSPTSRGVHDCYPVLVLTNEPYGEVSINNYKVCTWMNNQFQGYPSGAREVTHWCYLELPE